MIQYFSTILWPVLVGGAVDSQLAFHHRVNNFAYLVSQLYALYMFTSHTQNGQNRHTIDHLKRCQILNTVEPRFIVPATIVFLHVPFAIFGPE